MKKYFLLIIILFAGISKSFANTVSADSVEVYIIDSYVTNEKPTIFHLSFFTSAPVKSKILIDKRYEFNISDTLTDSHKATIDLKDKNFDSKSVPFYVIVEDSAGNKFRSDSYDIDFPKIIKVEKESNFLLLGVFFGMQYLLPNPAMIVTHDKNYFGITKEIPLISFRGQNINYPFGYFSLEYSHIYHADASNFLRLGYKQIISTPVVKYISPGFDGFTNFDGYNGLSFEVSVGLFDVLNSFTLYTRYRYNTQPSHTNRDFHEISIGLYSDFFSFHVN